MVVNDILPGQVRVVQLTQIRHFTEPPPVTGNDRFFFFHEVQNDLNFMTKIMIGKGLS